jgi:ABC-type Fe3+/spermidine/putrescine transport system ATPase subunit
MSIVVRDLVKRYGDKTIIDRVSFEIAEGELVSLLGPSGCGKTTTLRCIAGLETPEEGFISIDGTVVFDSSKGVAVEPYHRDIGMVFQSYAIWPHMTVFENVAFPLRIRRHSTAEIRQRVARALDMVGLGDFHDRSSQQLSGGQQQRVAVARAIVHAPAVLLFDEPLSNLDAKLRDRTRAEIRKLQRELNVATVYVTHDQAEALSLSDRMLVMHGGRIRQQGTPAEVYGMPVDSFVADVVGPANFLPVVGGALPDGSVVRATGSGDGVAMIRPDRLFIGGVSDNVLNGTIRQRLYLGGHHEYLVAVGPSLLRVLSSVTVAEGEAVTLSFAAADCIILPATQGDSTSWA